MGNKLKTSISDSRRKNFSKRASKGGILVEKLDTKCNSCTNKKFIVYQGENSLRYNKKKCTVCGEFQ